MQPGYLHRGFEKSCERGTWNQVFPYVDRLNYVSPMLNNVGFSLAVEKLAGLKVPDRCTWYRMILGELARISDHLTCNSASAMELGAFTPFLWCIKVRDYVWDILEQETGARLTHSFGRIGGMAKPSRPSTSRPHILACIPQVEESIAETEALLLKNRIFLDRTQGIGNLLTKRAPRPRRDGPGAPLHRHGLRRPQGQPVPRSTASVDFEVPVGHDGDNWDRFMCRFEEVHQSLRIIEQCLDKMPDSGPVSTVTDPRITLPGEERGLQHHRGHHRALQAHDGGREAPQGRGLQLHRGQATESSASSSSATAAAPPTASVCVRRAGSTSRRCARWSWAT
jgi:NADH-quinone oxidoreductase subunit D